MKLRKKMDLKNGKLSYILNNELLGTAYNKLYITNSCRMQYALSLELVSKHASKDRNKLNCSDLLEYINYIRSISSIYEKIKDFEVTLNKYGINMNGEIINDCIDCLVVKAEYNKIYELLECNNFDISINLLSNL